MNIVGLVHVNINCSNFERSRRFYEALGFRVVWEVPPTNTPAVCAAVGLPDYRVKGAVMALEGAKHPLGIDLLEWESPRDDAPPYARLNHLGLGRLALATSNLDADVAMLTAMGVEFLSPPVRVVNEDGTPRAARFVCFKDPDGTILELVEGASVIDVAADEPLR